MNNGNPLTITVFTHVNIDFEIDENRPEKNHSKVVKINGENIIASDDTGIGEIVTYKPVVFQDGETVHQCFNRICDDINQTHHRMKITHENADCVTINQPTTLLHDWIIEFMKRILNAYMPLGVPSIHELNGARSVLEDIETEINNQFQNHSEESKAQFIIDKSNDFYEMIPHVGRSDYRKNLKPKRPKIDSVNLCRIKNDVINRLESVIRAIHTGVQQNGINAFDYFYNSFLNVELRPILSDANFLPDFNIGNSDRIKHLFSVEKEEWNGAVSSDMQNHHYLFHSTHLANMVDILREGLRIAPDHVYSFNRWYGKGIYFFGDIAGAISYANRRNQMIILVCRVALGEKEILDKHEFHEDQNFVYPLRNKQSLVIHGYKYRSTFQWKETHNAYLPSQLIMTNVVDATDYPYGHYDEFLVQNENQVKIEHIIELKY